MSVEPIVTFFLLLDLRKIMRVASPEGVWDKKIKITIYAVAALFTLEIFLPVEIVTRWIGHLLLFAIIGITLFNAAFAAARTIIYAVLPFALLSLFSDLLKTFLPDQYSKIANYLNISTVFTVIWMVGMLITSRKQQRALEAERKKTQLQEEQKIQITERKAELENLVAERTIELTRQKEELEKALVELKTTQAQLIQSEKMASLGELTAGISHEIQNPLNFVNNFSEINTELIEELQKEIGAGNAQEAFSISNSIKENEQKIIHHGKRADAIVKGMLQHSRTSTGKKEPTDINALADEYLRLSYHGLRAKDKSFNVTMHTDFDNSLPKINIVPQDVGRVILNIFNNAFYSVNDKKKLRGEGYEPTVSVTTKKITSPQNDAANWVSICIRDNGIGIPQKVVDKIYQPFFSTKPTGQGTGLGLSISYDIITKVHGGQIKVETKEGEFAEFIISLPAN